MYIVSVPALVHSKSESLKQKWKDYVCLYDVNYTWLSHCVAKKSGLSEEL